LAPPTVQRACIDCDDEQVQAKAAEGDAAEPGAAEVPNLVPDGPGVPLPAAERAFFEPRFGRNFGQLRVHADGQAAESARRFGALAYTLGRDVVFAAGQYAPDTPTGRRLLAHELAHVSQQGDGIGPRGLLQRLAFGTSTPPTWRRGTLVPVPTDEVPRVNEALAHVREIVDNREAHSGCHDFFARRCPGGTATSLADTFARAVMWKLLTQEEGVLARGEVSGSNIAYTQAGYNAGAYGLAGSIVHELMHNCGIGESSHYLAAVAGLYCVGDEARNRLTLAGGLNLRTGDPVFIASYRRFLADWAGGHFQPTVGGDISVSGPPESEFGSAMLGIQGRTNLLWGGDRFGGLTARVETGFGVGRYTVRPPLPGGAPTTAIGGGVILQVGAGAEFWIPIGAHALPVSVDAALRLSQPVNAEAERIHSAIFSASFAF
jgi:hypothetical protein